jgi:translation initiation factor 5A
LDKTTASLKDLKPNGFVLIDDAPCRVEKVQVSSSGKHGAAKCRVDALGLLDNRRRSIVKPADDTIDVPIVTKDKAQVLSVSGNKAQLMDLNNYTIFELDIPEERKDQVIAGSEIDYFEVCDTKTLKELK